MASIDVKNINSPDETRPFADKGQRVRAQLSADHVVLYGTFEPGWRWSEHVKPIAGTDTCQVNPISSPASRDLWVWR